MLPVRYKKPASPPHRSRPGIAYLFDEKFTATPLQEFAETVDLPDGPLLFIVEDMTGAGKTEAAVILSQRLMLAGKAKGLYIALPTMATANAMFTRLASSYRRLFDETPSIVLTHGRRDLFRVRPRNAHYADAAPPRRSGDRNNGFVVIRQEKKW